MRFVIILVLSCYTVFGQDVSTLATNSKSTEAPMSSSSIKPMSQTSEKSINIKDIPSLTFKAGRLAIRQRTTPAEQLKCLGGCTGELPKSAQCENKGWDGMKVNWKCEARVEKGRTLQETRVRCESNPEGSSEFILPGSCVLEYSLGGRSHSGGGGRHPNQQPRPDYDSHSSKGLLSYIVPIIMIVIVVFILCSVVKACSRNESGGVVNVQQPGYVGGYPAQGYPAQGYPSQPGFNPGYAAPMAAPMMVNSGRSGSNIGAGVGGFAAGAATGGLLGYMLGNSGSHDHHHYGNGGGGGYGAYGDTGGDYNAGDMGGGGGFEMSTDFADTGMD